METSWYCPILKQVGMDCRKFKIGGMKMTNKLVGLVAVGLGVVIAIAAPVKSKGSARGIASVEPSKGARRQHVKQGLDTLIQKNCEGDLSEIELMAINAGELQGMMEKEEISDRQLKIESAATHEALSNIAEGCAKKIHKRDKIFVEASRIEAKLLKLYLAKSK
jgi:hypothetical protein